jgi:hypothetical protein
VSEYRLRAIFEGDDYDNWVDNFNDFVEQCRTRPISYDVSWNFMDSYVEIVTTDPADAFDMMFKYSNVVIL